jgi:hypothetical protein
VWKLSLNFSIYTMIFKRAQKLDYLLMKNYENFIFKSLPYKANKFLTHIIWVHNNESISIASSYKITCETLFLGKNLSCQRCLFSFVVKLCTHTIFSFWKWVMCIWVKSKFWTKLKNSWIWKNVLKLKSKDLEIERTKFKPPFENFQVNLKCETWD